MFVNPLPLPGARRSVTDPRRSRDVHASSRTGFRRNARLENVPACRGVRLVPRWKGTVFGKCEGDERWQGIAKFDNARHAADLIAGNNINNVIATTCFRTGETPADLSRSLGHYDDINHTGTAGGCYACADLNGPNHRQKVNACLCGARNAPGQWARTDAAASFTYISSPGYRATLDCTTN